MFFKVKNVNLERKTTYDHDIRIYYYSPTTTINYSDEEIQRRQDTNQTNERFENDEEMTIAQKRESNKRQRPDSNSDRISPFYKTRNIKNQNNSIPENSIFTTPDSSKETFEIDPFNETYLKCCHKSIKHYIDNTFICKCNFLYYKYKCGWKFYETHLSLYQCDNCDTVIAECSYCETLNKKGETEKCIIKCKKCQTSFDSTTLTI